MAKKSKTKAAGMKPIWYFVGWLLLVIGVIVCATGLYGWIAPPDQKTVLYELHTGIWWGAIITLAGLVFVLANKNATVE